MLDNLDAITKNRLKIFSIFTSILVLMILILSGFAFLAKSSWNSKLAVNISEVLFSSRPEEFGEGKLKVGNPVPINSAISVSSNMYEIVNNSGKVSKYALITRVNTYYGPQAAVYLYDQKNGVTFEGFACLNSRVAAQFVNIESDIILNHWIEKAETIFNDALSTKGAKNE